MIPAATRHFILVYAYYIGFDVTARFFGAIIVGSAPGAGLTV